MKVIPEQAKSIHGLMTDNELSVLCRMAWSARSIVELGCFKGRSLAAMGLSNPEAKLYGVDFFGDMSHRNYQGSTLEQTKINLKNVGVDAEFYVGKTDDVANKFDHEIELLHIDAGHSYEECMNDLNKWVPKINEGGAVCIHDYGIPHSDKLKRPEVKQAVDDWRNSEYEEIERDGTMIAFRNILLEQGVLYVAYGEKAKAQVLNSIQHLRKYSELPVAVVSDEEIPGACFSIIHREVDAGARAQKTRMYSLSPFRETLFLDADTEVQKDPSFGFELLKYVDVVMGQDVNRRLFNVNWSGLDKAELQKTKTEVGMDMIYYNSGVIFFKRNDRNRKLFQIWNREWERFGKHDQLALARAMKQCPVRIATMREKFNTHKQSEVNFVFHKHRTASRQGAPK